MNVYLLSAACLTFIVGFIHSVLGEVLIFRHVRTRGFIPIQGGTLLKERQVRILWVSWHLVTIFGWGLAAILLRLAYSSDETTLRAFVETVIMLSMLAASLLVLLGTKGKHPGWLGLFGVVILLWLTRGNL